MKKLLSIVSVFLLFLSCGKEPNTPDPGPSGGGSGSGGGDAYEITDITLPAPLLLLDAAGDGGLLEVKLSPSSCTTDMLNVKVTPEGIVDWERRSDGFYFKPKKIGEASVSLSAKSGPASSRQATVRVLSSEDYASTAITKITLASSEVYLKEGDTQGKVVGVTLEPSSATSQMLKFSGASDLVTVSAVEGGIKFVPKQVGTGSVQVQPRKGSAEAQSIAVVVLSKDAYSDYVISNISSSPASVEVTDETTANVTLTLTPSAAALKDLIIASQDETVATVAQGSGTKLVVTGKKPGSTKILVRGIREGSKSIEIPVTVYGHVTGISISPSSGNEVLKAKSITLKATVTTTGNLKSNKVEWSAAGETVSVELTPSLGTTASSCTVYGYKAGGEKDPAKVTATLQGKSATVDVYVYDVARSIEAMDISGDAYDMEGSVYSLKEGKTYSIKWKVLPETARQKGEITFETSSATVSSVRSGDYWVTTIKVTGANTTKHEFLIRPVDRDNNTSIYYKYFYLSHYLSSDIKPGDYVYYNSSTGRFNWSDGGLRYSSPNEVRVVSQSSQQSVLGTLIGQIYDTKVPTTDAAFNSLTKPGFANKNGAHACVLSINLAHEKGQSNDYWRWSEDSDNVYGMNDWKNGPYPVNGESGKDYSTKLNIIHYNSKSGGSHKIKPGYVVTSFDTETFGDFGDVSKYATYASLGHTGWMLPLRSTAETIAYYKGTGVYQKVFSKMNSLYFPSTSKAMEYWTAEQFDADEAWYFSFVNVSYKKKDPGTDVNAKPYIRPVLWL